jgi:major intracellular serine protease
MKVTVTKNLNIRSGKPYITDTNNVSYYAPGQQVEVDRFISGQAINGNDKWFAISNTNNYAWTGGTDQSQNFNLNANPYINLVDYSKLMSNIPQEWIKTKGAGINVAVFDSGINTTHIDFNNIFSSGNNGIDYTNSPSGLRDVANHGTHVSSLIGARTPNTHGIIGLAPQCNLFVIKVGDDSGSFFSDSILKGLTWASQNNIDIINMSFSINYQNYKNILPALGAIKNCVIVASAGEDDVLTNDNEGFFYPAMDPNIISIGAIKQATQGDFYPTLNYLLPLIPVQGCSGIGENSYIQELGSSMSAAHLTGLIALYLSFINKSNINKGSIINALDKIAIPFNASIPLTSLTIIKP